MPVAEWTGHWVSGKEAVGDAFIAERKSRYLGLNEQTFKRICSNAPHFYCVYDLGVFYWEDEPEMNEWYVFSEGGKPFEVILGRRHAVNRLTADDFKTTETEKKQIMTFLEGNVCDLGGGLLLVGMVREPGKDKVPDREITRVLGPGALV